LEIAISIYDIKENIIAFSWNTASCKDFSIGESFVHVEEVWQNGEMPASNEILHIDVEKRQIIAPDGYNTTVCNYGDIGTSKVFFIVNRYVRGIDLMDDQAAVGISIAYETMTSYYITIPKEDIVPYSQNANKVIICWKLPRNLTNNADKYVGNFLISLKFEEQRTQGENIEITKRWVSSSFNQLSIGPSLLTNTADDLVEHDETILQNAINEYLNNHYFIMEA
jgi:hypothetical protein